MKNLHFITLLMFCWACSSKRSGNVDSVVSNRTQDTTEGNRYALIIGISDYQNEAIQPLKYAHIDAIEFKKYLMNDLRMTDSDNVITLLNDEATDARIMWALNDLVQKVKRDDQVFFYFAGHGDVEGNVKFKIGVPYFLTHNTNPSGYFQGGLEMKDICTALNTLVGQNRADVYLILDACRSAEVTNENDSKRILQEMESSNELTKILSCGANQYSLEDKKWGGGRGLFSFFLLKGLHGEADEDENSEISTYELELYLKRVVYDESKGQQVPEVFGDKLSVISISKDAMPIQDVMAGPRCKEETEVKVKKLVQKYLTSQEEEGSFDFTQELNALSLEERCNVMELLNEVAFKEIGEHFKAYVDGETIYFDQPYFLRVARMADYLYNELKEANSSSLLLDQLKERHYFFKARGYAQSKNMEQLHVALEYLNLLLEHAPGSTYAQNVYGIVYKNLGDTLSAQRSFQLARRYHPNWEYPLLNITTLFREQGQEDSARAYLNLLMELNPDFSNAHYMSGLLKEDKGNYGGARMDYEKAILLDSLHPGAYNNLGHILSLSLIEKERERAQKMFMKAIEIEPQHIDARQNLAHMLIVNNSAMEAIPLLEASLLYIDEVGPYGMATTEADVYDYLGWAHENVNALEKAETCFRKKLELTKGSAASYYSLILNQLKQGRQDKAYQYLKEGLKGTLTEGFFRENPDPLLDAFFLSDEVQALLK